MKILSASQMGRIDQGTVQKQNISSLDLMERAANVFYTRLMEDISGFMGCIHIFCGPGNNGGDGLAVGRKLFQAGNNVRIYSIGKKFSEDFMSNRTRLDALEIQVISIEDSNDFPDIFSDDLVIDAIFGIGLNRAPSGIFKELIQKINNTEAVIYAIDIPSGMFSEKAVEDKESVVKADYVFSFQLPKFSFFMPDSVAYLKNFEILNIGLDSELIENSPFLAQTISVSETRKLLPVRNKFDHKGAFGHVGIVGGSYGKIGATVLASKSAFKVGAGMVTTIVPKCGYEILQTAIPEAMVITDDADNALTEVEIPDKISTIAVGMGMGTSSETMIFFENLLQKTTKPVVIDADGLNCLAQKKELLDLVPKNSVLTPHPKELERLIGKWENDFEKIEKAQTFSKKHEIVLLVKGAFSMVFYQDSIYINLSGNPGMATAGSGDTLSGMIAGIIAQQYDSLSATIFATFLHGLAGDLASKKLSEYSVTATDLINFIPEAYRFFKNN